MENSEEHRVVGKIQFGSFGIHAEAPLLLSTVSFFAFPLALVEFSQVKSTGEMLAVGFAIVTWMIATLVGIKRIPDIEIAQQPSARIRLQRACVLQAALLAFGAVLLCLCSRFPAK
jgi:hypothetical protein